MDKCTLILHLKKLENIMEMTGEVIQLQISMIRRQIEELTDCRDITGIKSAEEFKK